MKELSIEEKAKAYDEAIKRLEDIKTGKCQKTFVFTEGLFDYIFPELKESDGEKWIPKEIAKYLKEKGDFRSCWLAWLEKQCEQKIKTPEESLGIDSDTYNKIVDECIYGEQKPIDKVEPNFKVGDWVIWDNKIPCHVDNIYQGKNSLMYTITDTNNMTRSYSVKGFDNNAHLWTIKDARNGDVLFTSSTASHETFIFKNIDEKGNAKCYFAYDSEDGFREGKYHFIGRVTKCKPATKEQHDILFQKMKEAGYEWDAEKKELIKIEQKPAWSEEDEKQARQIERIVHNDGCTQKLQKQIADWFKSLKERCTWKPNEEQMNTLEYYMHTLICNEHKEVLFGLYADLKKLREK